jgi:hypothetical protein
LEFSQSTNFRLGFPDPEIVFAKLLWHMLRRFLALRQGRSNIVRKLRDFVVATDVRAANMQSMIALLFSQSRKGD